MTVEAMTVEAMTVTAAAAGTVTARTVTATVTVDLTEVATITTRNGPTATAAMTGATATRSGQSAAAVITTAVMAARTGGPDMVGTLSHDRFIFLILLLVRNTKTKMYSARAVTGSLLNYTIYTSA